MLFVTDAFAMAGPQGAAGAGQSASGMDMLLQFFPLILMFVIFYFLLIRPQQKRAKAVKAMLAALKKGDYVVTSAGLMGRIVDIEDERCTVQCGEAMLEMTRAAVATVTDKDFKPLTPEPARKK